MNEGEKLSFAWARPGQQVRVGNRRVDAAPLVGVPYGGRLTLVMGQEAKGLQRVSAEAARAAAWEKSGFADEASTAAEVIGGGNAGFIDTNTAQALAREDIHKMLKDGASAEDMVSTIVANSATFAQKSAFAQAKYIKKKRQKYRDIDVLVLRPTAKNVADAYYSKSPLKVQGLRFESVAHIMSLANVAAGARVLCVDHVRGLLAAAAMERLGGHGVVCASSAGGVDPSTDATRMFNFSDEEASVFYKATLQVLEGTEEPKDYRPRLPRKRPAGGDEGGADGAEGGSDAARQEGDGIDGGEAGDQPAAAAAAGESEGKGKAKGRADGVQDTSAQDKASKPKVNSLLQRRATAAEAAAMRERGFTSVIVAAQTLDPTALLRRVLPLCAPSAAIVVYSQYSQPLAEAMHFLTSSRSAIGLQLSEAWVREHQVLPKRTHPIMSTQQVGGFVLSGYATQAGVGGLGTEPKDPSKRQRQ